MALQVHLNHTHSEEKPFKCEFCEYRSKYKYDVKIHQLKIHFPETAVRAFSCPECPYKSTSNAHLKTHLMIHTGEKPFACEFCSYRSISRYDASRHALSHSKEKPIKCSQCEFACSHVQYLRIHVRRVHTHKGARRFSCSYPGCDKTYTVNAALKLHVLSIHEKKTCSRCPYCPMEFYTNSYCTLHIRRHHTKEKRFMCNTCNYTAVTISEISQHTAWSHGEFLGLECPNCHKSYKNEKSLARHLASAHQAQPPDKMRFTCDFDNCDKQYANRSSLTYHITAFHLKQKPFKCPLCEHSFASSCTLSTHIKSHTGEKPYKCDLCQRCFACSRDLGSHKATVDTKARPFKCDLCEFSTKTRKLLKHHQKIHYPVPALYECAICKERGETLFAKNKKGSKLGAKYVFRSKSTLQRHMKRHCEEKPYKCSLCDYAGKLHQYLAYHLRKFHKVAGHPLPSFVENRAAEFGPDQLNQVTPVKRQITEGDSGTNFHHLGKCRPCCVRMNRLKTSNSTVSVPNQEITSGVTIIV